MTISSDGLSTCFLIILYNVLDGTGLLVSYVIAIQKGTIQGSPFVPYVSDLGDKLPNSSWFTLFLSSDCLLFLFIVRAKYALDRRLPFPRLSQASYYTGLAVIPGKLVVASFQLNSSKTVHYLGASLFFGASLIYNITQIVLTVRIQGSHDRIPRKIQRSRGKVEENKTTRVLLVVRGMLGLGMIASVVIFMPFACIPSLASFNRYGMNIAQGAEWAAVFFNTFFIFTFVYDFWGVQVRHRVIIEEAVVVDVTVDEVDSVSPLLGRGRYGTYRPLK